MSDLNTTTQPAPERLLRLHDLLELTALSRATIYREISAGNFPAPIKIAGASRWPASEVTLYIEGRKSARDTGTGWS